MKILIVDDDSFSRKILRNLLGKFECEIIDAIDGVEALDLIAREEPDLVLLDVVMPVLDGLATLQELRASGAYGRIPVVTVSAQAEKEMVMKLIDLGISGFLLKPLKPQDTLRRLEAVIHQIKNMSRGGSSPRGPRGPNSQAPVLLLAERDPNFRQFASPLLESRFQVVEASTGAAAWQAFNETLPEVVLVGDTLQMIGPDRLLSMIRDHPRRNARVYLLREGGSTGAEEAQFDGVIQSSFVPETFSKQLEEVLFGQEDVSRALMKLVRAELEPEMVTATMQTIGVMTSQDVEVVRPDQQIVVHSGVQVAAELLSASGEAAVLVGWASDRANAEKLGSKILGFDTTLEDGCGDAIAEIANTIAGRVRASLAEKGYTFEQGSPTIEVDVENKRGWLLAREFRTTDGETFVVAVTVERRAEVPEEVAA